MNGQKMPTTQIEIFVKGAPGSPREGNVRSFSFTTEMDRKDLINALLVMVTLLRHFRPATAALGRSQQTTD